MVWFGLLLNNDNGNIKQANSNETYFKTLFTSFFHTQPLGLLSSTCMSSLISEMYGSSAHNNECGLLLNNDNGNIKQSNSN